MKKYYTDGPLTATEHPGVVARAERGDLYTVYMAEDVHAMLGRVFAAVTGNVPRQPYQSLEGAQCQALNAVRDEVRRILFPKEPT